MGGLQALMLLVLFTFSATRGGVLAVQIGCVFSMRASHECLRVRFPHFLSSCR